MTKSKPYPDAVILLKQLIGIPSLSRQEDKTADCIQRFFTGRKIQTRRHGNNVWCANKHVDIAKPTLLLNSHHDTVAPNAGYTRDPFTPDEEGGKLFGLGSNDAGGALVALIAAFLHFYEKPDLNYNLILAATAEEEISGVNGLESLLPQFGNVDLAIVGEPTQMEMAVAERGLLVIDCMSSGRSGHVAGNEGENALYKAIDDMNWIRNFRFPKISDLLGETKMNVTVMETENRQHNVVPAQCRFVIDVRVNELYPFDEVLDILKQNLRSSIQPRSTRLRSTIIPTDHPIVKAGQKLGKGYYGSPTTSDKALMPFPALKMGPGNSSRSHIADEFIYLKEIEEGIETYIKLIGQIV
jgi:acetylornithine deacetylase